MDTSKHPFRILVFGTSERVVGKGKRAKTVRQGFGYVLWNPCEQTAERAGRSGFGSFEWYGLAVTRRAALDALAQPGIEQVSIRTNQDRSIATLHRSQWDKYVGQSRLQM
jgi:hypothetical protein